jgi:NTP pyrophosphatase (non-canonical NTP hydrolase)
MATAATPAALRSSHVSEVIEVAAAILQRHRDEDLAKKVFVMRGCLEMSQMHPERDYQERLNKALADLTAAVHLHLNVELHAVATLFARLAETEAQR